MDTANSKCSTEKANQWYERQPWLVGCNFIPSTAVNQLEMWQADSFDPDVIERELGWAAGLGFNAARVYLHDLLWFQDAGGFKDRISRYLDIAGNHQINTVFVLFDDCWYDDPKLGKQPEPKPGIHSSAWVKAPGNKVVKQPASWGRLEAYVKDIVGTFKLDERVILWDIYNEPGNDFLVSLNAPALKKILKLTMLLGQHFFLPLPTASLLKAAFTWARAVEPTQPLTTGLWYLRENLESRLNGLALALSDVISFHSYFDITATISLVEGLQKSGRPLLCTEYLKRNTGCTFETHLPYFKAEKIGCFNWGLVSGKTQTIYSWEDHYPDGEEPPVWFHDILRKNGTPYRQEEVAFIRESTKDGGLS